MPDLSSPVQFLIPSHSHCHLPVLAQLMSAWPLQWSPYLVPWPLVLVSLNSAVLLIDECLKNKTAKQTAYFHCAPVVLRRLWWLPLTFRIESTLLSLTLKTFCNSRTGRRSSIFFHLSLVETEFY